MNEIKLTAHILNRVFLLSLIGPEAYETDKKNINLIKAAKLRGIKNSKETIKAYWLS